MKRKSLNFLLIFFCFVFFLFSIYPVNSKAGVVEDLQQKIENIKAQRQALEEENSRLESQIQQTSSVNQTLQSALKNLETSQKKLENDLKVTESKINSASLTIEQSTYKISEQERQIAIHKKALAESIRNLNEAIKKSIIDSFLKNESISDMWNDINDLENFKTTINTEINNLQEINTSLAKQIREKTKNKTELVSLKSELADRKTVIVQNKDAKAQLLEETKNKEAEYKKLLALNIQREKDFEQEMFKFESQLKITLDPSSIPTPKRGILSWPLDKVFITQKFGKTVGASKLYVSGSHNGVDFRATVGTPVRTVLSGTVRGTGNTDEQKGCYSYGRWVLIDHNNGLTTIYAHLSASMVKKGQILNTGDVIGLSGGQPGSYGSGYSTGPHLHLGLFATQGVQIEQFVTSRGCKQVMVPFANPQAYLDPLAYLPYTN